jgi:hypothetical protein
MRNLATILAFLLIVWSRSVAAEERPRPVVGAIRWDAWTGGAITEQVERSLGPKEYHDRLPWFAEVIGENKVRIDGSPQEVMDREIDFATRGGLDYWAFLIYGKSSPMSAAIKQYLRSSKRERIGFCVILHNTLKSSESQWPSERDRLISLLKEPGYQTVLGGRPLVYAFSGGPGFPFERFSEFRRAAEEAGLDPYCVFMGWNPAHDFKLVSSRGFDAVSAYAKGGDQKTFAELVESVETGYWENAAGAGVPYVPFVTTGWDKRPRQDHPVSWEKDHGYHQQKRFPSTATPRETGEHLERAVRFSRKHQEICAANAVIIYAWNEHDEGGWLSPTLSADGKPDTGRLEAIRRVLEIREGQ